MGTMIFQLPPDLPAAAREELERASVLGGQDNMPYQTQVLLEDSQVMLHRSIQESGAILVPWNVTGAGQVMVASGSLMERLAPYHLLLELARGKVNQLRNQTSDWLQGGLVLPEDAAQAIRQATHTFSLAVTHYPDGNWSSEAQRALEQAFQAADLLVHTYMSQVMQIRHQRQPKLETLLACRHYPSAAGPEHESACRDAFNSVSVALPWALVEPRENEVQWQACDNLINWATQHQMHIVGGPLIDFSGRGLPDWLWEKETDLLSLCGYLSDYVGMVVQRYHGVIRTWQISAGSNWAGVLALADEELLWLTVRLVEAARKVDPNLDIVIGIAQPLGDYLAHQERSQSPFAFADTLLRTGLRLGGLELELVMGVQPRGSYCRDLLDVSRVLDLYALLGLPLHVTLAYPSSTGADAQSDSDLRLAAGIWRDGFRPEVQTDWARNFAGLATCKPYVRAVNWSHWSDAAYHQFPHCGLVDSSGNLKPALAVLKDLRAAHLK
jgi:hypothetical protein